MKAEGLKGRWEAGKEWVRRLLSDGAVPWGEPAWGVIPTGLGTLDDLLCGGGLPRGQLVEVGGYCQSAMARLGGAIIGQVAGQGGWVVLMDLEGGVADQVRPHLKSLDSEQVLLIQPSSGEEALTVCRTLIQSGQVDLILGDCLKERHFAGSTGATGGVRSRMAVCRKLLEQGMIGLARTASRFGTCVVFMNHTPVVSVPGGGVKDYSHHRYGNWIRFQAALRLRVEGQGREVEVRLIKNNVNGIRLGHPAIYGTCPVSLR